MHVCTYVRSYICNSLTIFSPIHLGMAIENLPAEVNEAVRYSLSVYLIILCGLSILTELEWFPFIVKSRLLNNWISRGFVYIFMALLSIDQASLSETTNEKELKFIKMVSYCFAAVGAGYSLMGMLFMQIWLKRLREDHGIRRKGGQLKKRDAARNHEIIQNPKDMDAMEIA